MAKLIIHIGLRKTGSSALQESLNRNQEKLKALDIVYPSPLVPWPAHQELAWCFQPEDKRDFELNQHITYGYYKNKIYNYLAGRKTIILSSEDLSLLSFNIDAMSFIRDNLSEFDPTIVMYTRSDISMQISNYKHDIMSGRLAISFSDYIFNSKNLCTYNQPMIKTAWRSIFPKTVDLKYENISQGQILNHFLNSTLRCEFETEELHLSNTGVDYEILKQALLLNKSELSDKEIKEEKGKMRNQYRKKIQRKDITREPDKVFLEKALSEHEINILNKIYGLSQRGVQD